MSLLQNKNILLVTQVVDINDLTLGFFHRWLEELAPHTRHIEVICLKEGTHSLPKNVHVHSLGKEKKNEHRIVYAFRFLHLVWKLRGEYDYVFVHMNQEYVLLAGMLWRFLGKRIYLWRNHYAGSWLTDLAVWHCHRVFCTSKHSYTAKYKNVSFMPVGVDIDRFVPDARIVRKKDSLLFFSRIAPSKRPELFVEALAILHKEGIQFSASIVGSAKQEDEGYYESLKMLVRNRRLSQAVTFIPGIRNADAPDLYSAHSIFVNCSPSGMFDKVLFEAGASGCLVLASSEDWKELVAEVYAFSSASELAQKIRTVLSLNASDWIRKQNEIRAVTATHSLSNLIKRIEQEILS